MNHKPQMLPALTTLAAVAGLSLGVAVYCGATAAAFADESVAPAAAAGQDAQTDIKTPAAAETPKPAESATADSLPAAGEVLTQLRTKMEGLDSFSCALHQTSIIAGMKLVAAGSYVEAAGNKVRLEYTIYPMQPEKAVSATELALDAEAPELDEANNRGILLQVSNGVILNTSWKNGDAQRVSRRNIKDILAAAQGTTYDPQSVAMDLGIGGLRGLISRLQAAMEFAPVKLVKVGERQLYEVTGRWNERIRKEVLQIPAEAIVDPRPQVPEYVRVYVDVETMLPRRIQFLKRSLSAEEKAVRPMITLDIRNPVVNKAVDEQLFTFQTPENTPEEDQTQQTIEMIKRSLQDPAAAPVQTPAKQP